jgi:diacylglycerol kinase family enzyme
MREAVYLVHTRAGRGRADVRLRRLLARNGAGGSHRSIVRISSPAEALRAVAQLEPHQFPVAAGGDGAAAMVAAALLEAGDADTPVGVLPLGTANLLARNLGVPDPLTALQTLERGVVRRIDVIRTSDPQAPVALVSISAGWEGRFIAAYAAGRGLGRAAAGVRGLAAAGLHGEAVMLQLDGRTVLDGRAPVFSAGLYNTRFSAGGLVVSPDADPTDGECESFVYHTAASYAAAMTLRLLRSGRVPPRTFQDREHAHAAAGRPQRGRWKVALLQSPGVVQIDGEPRPPQCLVLTVEANALPVLVAES